MNIEDEHWEYTKKVITIGMKISVIAGIDKDSEDDFVNIMDCLAELYKEAFKHGFGHGYEKCLKDNKLE